MEEKETWNPLSPASESSHMVARVLQGRFVLSKVNAWLVSVMENGANALANAIENMGDGPAEHALADQTGGIYYALDKAELRKAKIEQFLEAQHAMWNNLLNAVKMF